METRTVKININNYRWLAKAAATLQKHKGAPVSLDEALSNMRKRKLSDLAGTWNLSKKETKNIKVSLKKGWSTWKIASV